MKVLTPRLNLHDFLARVASARERVLMLDYDGTLAPFHVWPECALPYPGVPDALADLMSGGGTRVVIVSGRRATELVPLLGLAQPPEIWGCHGWERLLPDGALHAQALSEGERSALETAAEAVQPLARRGTRIERKTASIALHWRGMSSPEITRLADEARAVWGPLVEHGSMELLAFDGGIELRARGCNKQHAAKSILSETGTDSVVAYLGDDVTDEDAFAAMKMRGIGVLVRPEYRNTRADIWLRPPEELLAFLGHWRGKRKNA